MSNDGTVPIYTQANWGALMHLWPHPKDTHSITLFVDRYNKGFLDNVAKLKRVNPYLAQLIENEGEEGHVTFRKAFLESPSKRTYGR